MSDQGLMFLYMAILGAVMGFIFDCTRILRRVVRHKNGLVYLEDSVYWLLMSFGVFYILLNYADGEIRFFYLLGIFLGMILYFVTLSKLIINLVVGFLKFLARLIKNCIIKPLWFIFVKPTKFLLKKIKALFLVLTKPIRLYLQKKYVCGKIRAIKYYKKTKRKIKKRLRGD